MIDLLHNISEGKLPLMAQVRSANRSRNFKGEKQFSSKMYHHIRCAYNSFIRCLNVLENPDSFKCLKCPNTGPDIIIMEGTAITPVIFVLSIYLSNIPITPVIFTQASLSELIWRAPAWVNITGAAKISPAR